ncbi:MAG: SDR family oxidoreductase [Rhodospirillaceae bacterium]|nr:MAG: SDR family oxidoreductase [Rhodospirillaceae bacterium]
MKCLADKVAVVLGAAGAGNMGQVIARRLAEEGAKVMVAGRHEAPLKELAAEIDGAFALCDITRKQDVESLVDTTISRFGKLDIGINAAGRGVMRPFVETTPQELADLVAIQFTGPFQFFQALVRGMSQGGSIIQISSATATIMLDNYAAYMGTKAGIDHVIRTIANEFGERGIKANSISPGLTDTPMTKTAFANKARLDLFRKEYPLGRLGTSQDIAAACVWLAGDESFITGQNLQINGGLTLRRNPRAKELMAVPT